MRNPIVVRCAAALVAWLVVAPSANPGEVRQWARSTRAQPGAALEPARFALDACGCGRELSVCLIAASLNLGRCVGRASTPGRAALCYLKFELDLVLCVQRSSACRLTCVP